MLDWAPRCSNATTPSSCLSSVDGFLPTGSCNTRAGVLAAHIDTMGAYRFGEGFVVGLADLWPRCGLVPQRRSIRPCRAQVARADYPLERPEIIPMDSHVLRAFPLLFRPVLARELTQCLWLHQPSQPPPGYSPSDAGADTRTKTAEQH